MKGPTLFQGDNISKYRKYIDEINKSSPPEPLSQFQTWHKTSLGDVKMKGHALFQGKIITQYWKIQRWNLKLFSHVRDVAHGPIVFHFFILVFVSILRFVLIMIDWFLLLHDLKTKLPSSYLSLLYAELLYTCTRYIELSLRYNRI